MKQMTLREVCDQAGVSRRAVQGYEKAGLVSPSGKNERGYLLYDTYALERIKEIKQYQDFEFSIKAIQIIIDASDSVKLVALKKQVLLKEENHEKESQRIEKMKELIRYYEENQRDSDGESADLYAQAK